MKARKINREELRVVRLRETIAIASQSARMRKLREARAMQANAIAVNDGKANRKRSTAR